jgi:type IV pilus assembly protein PilC
MMIFVYSWKGTTNNNDFLSGEIRAPHVQFAKAQLISLGITVVAIRIKFLFFKMKPILTSKTRVRMTEQIADLLGSGISMMRALKTIESTFSEIRIKTLFWLMQRYIESGQSFGNILYLFPKEFSAHYRQLVEIGEVSGQLETVLYRLAALEKKNLLIESKIKKASFYPILVFVFAFFITGFLLVGIIPKFVEIFDQAKLDLPWMTLLLMNVSKFLMGYSEILIVIISGLLFLLYYLFQTSIKIKKIICGFLLSIPYVGKIIQAFYMSRLSYALSILLQMGIGLIQAIDVFAKNLKNPLYAESLMTVRDLLENGNAFSESLRSSVLFPDFMISTLKIGEESGLMSDYLMKIALFYESVIDHFLDTVSVFLEPVLMLILGLIVSVFMVALYVPIFSLGNAVSV